MRPPKEIRGKARELLDQLDAQSSPSATRSTRWPAPAR